MSVLRSLELKLERLVEGAFSRAFKARVQPVELARKLAKEMESHRTAAVSRTYVPNEYTVYLSREDRKQFEGYEQALLDELSAHLLEHAAQRGPRPPDPAQGLVRDRPRLRMGEFGIQARLVKPTSGPEEASQGDLGATMVYSAARAREELGARAAVAEKPTSRALLVSDSKSFVIDRPRAVVGRSQRSDHVLADPNVSRRHFELQLRDGELVSDRPWLYQRRRRERTARDHEPAHAGRRDRRRHVEPAVRRRLRSRPGLPTRPVTRSTESFHEQRSDHRPAAVGLHRGALPVPAVGRAQRLKDLRREPSGRWGRRRASAERIVTAPADRGSGRRRPAGRRRLRRQRQHDDRPLPQPPTSRSRTSSPPPGTHVSSSTKVFTTWRTWDRRTGPI